MLRGSLATSTDSPTALRSRDAFHPNRFFIRVDLAGTPPGLSFRQLHTS
jgi:hypothetical protein